MKTERFHHLNEQQKPGCENCRQTDFGDVNIDPRALQLAAQDERRRIAQELHDTLLQGFTGIALKLEALTTGLPPALAETKHQLRGALEEMDHYLRETRYSVCNLRSPTLQRTKDLPGALLTASERALAGTRIALSFSVHGAPRNIGNVLEHHVLRICQEALANVVKHAQATKVEVVLDFTSRLVRFHVRDNGCGFEPESREASDRGHFGLIGIKERIVSQFGVLSVDSAPGRGTRLLVTIPTNGAFRAEAVAAASQRASFRSSRSNKPENASRQ